VDEAVVTTNLKRAHEYTNDLTEIRGLSKAEYVSEIVSYSNSTQNQNSNYRGPNEPKHNFSKSFSRVENCT